ncbi:unnamed protein product [Pleuronectes platessa]|uniref:Uncharacterized protein n=1 Tax=Pleuronectes platessa TaxID=8262 RepID=A0A9N7U3D8_PLEPL|nr:unnamed protein product [Pleuronectes platessa]
MSACVRKSLQAEEKPQNIEQSVSWRIFGTIVNPVNTSDDTSPLQLWLVEVICSRADTDNWAVRRGAEIYDGSEVQPGEDRSVETELIHGRRVSGMQVDWNKQTHTHSDREREELGTNRRHEGDSRNHEGEA